MKKSEKQTASTNANSFLMWIKNHIHLLLVFGGILLILVSMKTQTIMITDTAKQEYTVQLQYSVFGYCVSAIPMNKETQPIAAEYMFLLDGIDESVVKSATWISEKSESGVEIFINGYPRNKDRLLAHLIQVLDKQGIEAVKMETEQ